MKTAATRLALCGVMALVAVTATATAASANGWVSWQSEEYPGYYLYSVANGNGARFGVGTNSAKNIYDWQLSNGNWLEIPYNGQQCMEANGSNGNLDTWSCSYSYQANEQWDESQVGAWPNTCWNLTNAKTGQQVDADAASGNLVGLSDNGYGCGPSYSPDGVAWK